MKGVKHMKRLKLSDLEKEKLKKAIWRETYKRHLREMKNEREVRFGKYYVKDFNVRYETLGTEKELTNVLEKTEKKYYQVNKGLRHLRFNREINNIYYLEKDLKKDIPDILYSKEEDIFLYDNGVLNNIKAKRYYLKGGKSKIRFRVGRYVREYHIKPISLKDINETFLFNGKKFNKNVLEIFMEETGRNVYVKDNV